MSLYKSKKSGHIVRAIHFDGGITRELEEVGLKKFTWAEDIGEHEGLHVIDKDGTIWNVYEGDWLICDLNKVLIVMRDYDFLTKYKFHKEEENGW